MVTAFRTTGGVTATRITDNLQYNLQKLQNLQGKLSSGKEVTRPSDNPSGAVSAMTYRNDLKRTEQYAKNAQDSLGWLGTADTTITSAIDSVREVRDRVLQGANGTADAESRAALAAQVKGIKEGLIGLANTTYLGRPIFAGTANPAGLTPPAATYAADGTYNGNTGTVFRTIGPDASVQVNLDGPTVWGDPAVDDMWKVLTDIESHLTSNDPAEINKLTQGYTKPDGTVVASDLDRLDARRLNLQNRVSETGARYHRVEQMQQRAEDNSLTIKSGLSEIEDIDLPATIIAVQLQNVAYQSALSASAKILQTSLVDFLR